VAQRGVTLHYDKEAIGKSEARGWEGGGALGNLSSGEKKNILLTEGGDRREKKRRDRRRRLKLEFLVKRGAYARKKKQRNCWGRAQEHNKRSRHQTLDTRWFADAKQKEGGSRHGGVSRQKGRQG